MPTIPIPAASARYAGGSCSLSCCAAMSITSTVAPGSCCTATPLCTSPAASCRRLQDPPRLPVPACAEVYRADTYQLIRAGLSGGKGIPATVAQHPCVFATLTAPSFGPVHSHREKDGRILKCRPADAAGTARTATPWRAGSATAATTRLRPLCPDCYDYTGSVLFNACAPNSGGASPSPCTGRLPARPG